jgi:lysophospholipase L1-like esterase
MKIFYRLLMLITLTACLAGNIFAGGNHHSISLKKELHLLIASEAEDYNWYFNGMEMGETGASVHIMAPGRYEVVMTDARGNQSTSNITVGINAEGEVYRVYIIGDSTAAFWDPRAYYPLTGWGQVLQYFFDDGVEIRNMALSARSSKSFYNNHWAPIRDSLKQGDFVFIQFGINDAKSDDTTRYTDPFTTFQEYLTLFVNESQEKGAFPVLLTTVRRNSWNDTDPPTVYPAYHDYPIATRELAGELGVPLIDVDQLAVPFLEALGPDYTTRFLYMNLEPGEYPKWTDGRVDDVHFQEMGANEMARLVTDGIQLYSEDTVMNRLIPHLKPLYDLSVSSNFPEGATITASSSYPEGVTVTLKAIVDSTYDLLEWQDGSENILGTADRIEVSMGAEPLTAFALLDDHPEPDCSGQMNGTAYLDDCGVCVEGTTGLLPCQTETVEGTYKLIGIGSGFCIQEGDPVTQENCIQEQAQLWELIREGDGYKIRNINSGAYLFCESIASTAPVSVGNQEMLWRLETAGADSFIITPQENPEFVLDIYDISKAGSKLRLYKRTGRPNQLFAFGADPTSIEGLQESEACRIYPNPMSAKATVEIDAKSGFPVTFELYNIQGKKLIHQSDIVTKRYEFGEGLERGFYIVKVKDGQHVQTLRLVKK